MTIDQLPSGALRVRVSAGTFPDGRRRVVTRTLKPGSSMDDARRLEMQLKLDAGRTTGEGELLSLGELVESWIRAGEKRRAAATQYKYKGIASRWIHPYPIAAKNITRVRTAEIESHLQSILEPEDGPRPEGTIGSATVRQVKAMLTGSFDWAARMGWIATNPASGCTDIRSDRSSVKSATPADVKAALQSADEVRVGLASLIYFLAATGCRRGEALAMRWSGIDRDTVTISEAVAAVPGKGVYVKDTKTHQLRRLRIDPGLVYALEQQRQLQLSVLEQCGEPFNPDGFIWSKDDIGQVPWRPDTAGKWIGKTGLTAGTLRHMMATEDLGAGRALHSVSNRLGHSRTSTTLDVYAHAIPAHDDDSAAFMGKLLGK